MKYAALMCGLLFAVSSAALAQDDDLQILNQDGLGKIRIGWKVEQVERVLRDKLGYNQYSNRGCSLLTTQALAPKGISFMIESKVLTRINVDFYGTRQEPLQIKTDAGISLASSEQDVLKAYPNAKVTPDAADPTWHTIRVETADQSRGIVFETDGKKVKGMRAGMNPAISYPRGCN